MTDVENAAFSFTHTITWRFWAFISRTILLRIRSLFLACCSSLSPSIRLVKYTSIHIGKQSDDHIQIRMATLFCKNAALQPHRLAMYKCAFSFTVGVGQVDG